jgi:ribosomal protein S18 acetylase RimI-like enzyme
MKKQIFANLNGFDSYVFLEGKNPKKIQVCKVGLEEVVIDFNTDAADCMGFCNIDDRLEKLEPSEQQAAIHCFVETLKQYYGGKNLLAVPLKLIEIFHKEGFRTLPETPNGSPYKRLMFVEKQDLKKNLEIISIQNKNLQLFTIINNKAELQKKSNEISRLLINNADYAANEDKRKGYSGPAINSRISNENVYPFAIQDNEGRIIAFMRVYIEPGIGAYVSDLVVSVEKQHQALGLLLMQKAFEELKDRAENVFLIAGNDKEVEYYGKNLGCKSVFSQQEGLNLSEKKIFMFGLFPQQSLLKEFLNDFPMPEPPEKELPSAATLSKFHTVASSSGNKASESSGKSEVTELSEKIVSPSIQMTSNK